LQLAGGIEAMTRTNLAALALWGLLNPSARLVAAQEAAPAAAVAHALSGLVRDSSGSPVAEAEVAVAAEGAVVRQVVTDTAGRFALRDVPAGQLELRVHRVGYQSRAVAVAVGAAAQPMFVEIVLTPVPAQLEEVVVNPTPVGRIREFYDHRKQRGGYGRFLELADIRRLAPTNSSELFRSVPGITIRAATTGGNTIRIRGCQPTVWVDGQRIPGAELDDVIQPNDIGGIEFYPSAAGIPPQYMDPATHLCGLILVWTRSQ
jgi:Carboxypeptidase regulatory-like domain/TonB-dependent Receptor Plug Domain